jgi:hypothetical protein
VTWTIVFSVVIAGIIFIQTSFKRALQGKIMTTADYMFWTKWRDDPKQYKGETTSFVKTKTQQGISARHAEREGDTNNDADSTVTENTVSSGVEEGSQPVLKTFDLNNVLP